MVCSAKMKMLSMYNSRTKYYMVWRWNHRLQPEDGQKCACLISWSAITQGSAIHCVVTTVLSDTCRVPYKENAGIILGMGLAKEHDDAIKWKHFPRYWPFVRGIDRSPVNSPHKGQWRAALMCSLMCAWINGWVNNGEAGDLRRHRTHYDVTVMR